MVASVKTAATTTTATTTATTTTTTTTAPLDETYISRYAYEATFFKRHGWEPISGFNFVDG